MKKLFALTAIVGLALSGCASTGTTTPVEPLTSYQRIVEIPNVKQDVIYENSRQWVAKNFRSANSVIQYQDKETGSIIGKGHMDLGCKGLACLAGTETVNFTLQIDAKDNRARVSFTDLDITTNPAPGTYAKPYTSKIFSESSKSQVKKQLDDTINSFTRDIANSATSQQAW